MADHQKSEELIRWFGGIVRSMKPGAGGKGSPAAATGTATHAGTKLVDQAAAQVMQAVGVESGDEAFARRSEIAALRRLQRELFSDSLRIRERLDKLELHTGLLRGGKSSGRSSGLGKTKVTGEVNAGAAVVVVGDSNSRRARCALEQAGMLTGLEVKFRLETPVREKDRLITECGAGQVAGGAGATLGGPVSLRKVAYTAEVSDRVVVSVAPLGGDSRDMMQSAEPVEDVGLTTFSHRPALHSHCKGSGIGAIYKAIRSVWSVSQHLGGWENMFSSLESSDSGTPLCLSTLAQVTAVPCDFMAFSVSALHRFWPSPPFPSTHGLHWSEMGPLVLSRTKSPAATMSLPMSNGSPGQSQVVNWSTSSLDSGLVDNQGSSMRSFALAAEADFGPVNVGGWAQVDCSDWLQEKKQLQWLLSVASPPGSKVGGGLTVGLSKPDFWSSLKCDESSDPGHSQVQMEAFLRWSCAPGFVLQPGILYIADRQSRTPAFMLRSSWSL